MFSMRVTKYNPIYRDQNGYFTREEWISFYDIGKVFGEKLLDIFQYIEVENSYINSVIATMEKNNVQELRVVGLEKRFELDELKEEIINYKDYYSDEMLKFFKQIKDGDVLTIREIVMLCRLILREHIWCKLESMPNMYVHFGYDFYMYIGCASNYEDTKSLIEKTGLFAESFESPYL